MCLPEGRSIEAEGEPLAKMQRHWKRERTVKSHFEELLDFIVTVSVTPPPNWCAL